LLSRQQEAKSFTKDLWMYIGEYFEEWSERNLKSTSAVFVPHPSLKKHGVHSLFFLELLFALSFLQPSPYLVQRR